MPGDWREMTDAGETLNSIIETANDGISTIDGQGWVMLWNQRATEIFGFDRDEMLGQPLTAIIPERFR